MALTYFFLCFQSYTFPPQSCTTTFESDGKVTGCQQCGRQIGFFFWDAFQKKYVDRITGNVITASPPTTVSTYPFFCCLTRVLMLNLNQGFAYQDPKWFEALGLGSCMYAPISGDSPSYQIPPLDCAAFGLASKKKLVSDLASDLPVSPSLTRVFSCSYYTAALLKSGSKTAGGVIDVGFGQAGCPWFAIDSDKVITQAEWCNGTLTTRGISHVVYCADVPKTCVIKVCF